MITANYNPPKLSFNEWVKTWPRNEEWSRAAGSQGTGLRRAHVLSQQAMRDYEKYLRKKEKLINCTLSSIIGKNVAGIIAQVTNPKYISEAAEVFPKWRTLKTVRRYRENHKDWFELQWERAGDDSCNYTGCTVESDSCMIQITADELSKMNKQSLNFKP